MSRASVYVVIPAALLVVVSAVDRYLAEITNLFWHVRHGFHVEIGGIRVRVPLSYEADDPHGLPSLWITRLPGRLWHGGSGFISIDFRQQPSPEAMEVAEGLLSKGSTRVKKTKVGEGTDVFAGRQGTCVEYNAEIVRPPVNGYEIQCRFGADVSVELIGSPDLKNDFYDMIRTAEAVKRKN